MGPVTRSQDKKTPAQEANTEPDVIGNNVEPQPPNPAPQPQPTAQPTTEGRTTRSMAKQMSQEPGTSHAEAESAAVAQSTEPESAAAVEAESVEATKESMQVVDAGNNSDDGQRTAAKHIEAQANTVTQPTVGPVTRNMMKQQLEKQKAAANTMDTDAASKEEDDPASAAGPSMVPATRNQEEENDEADLAAEATEAWPVVVAEPNSGQPQPQSPTPAKSMTMGPVTRNMAKQQIESSKSYNVQKKMVVEILNKEPADEADCAAEPNAGVVTRNMAKKHAGKEDPANSESATMTPTVNPDRAEPATTGQPMMNMAAVDGPNEAQPEVPNNVVVKDPESGDKVVKLPATWRATVFRGPMGINVQLLSGKRLRIELERLSESRITILKSDYAQKAEEPTDSESAKVSPAVNQDQAKPGTSGQQMNMAAVVAPNEIQPEVLSDFKVPATPAPKAMVNNLVVKDPESGDKVVKQPATWGATLHRGPLGNYMQLLNGKRLRIELERLPESQITILKPDYAQKLQEPSKFETQKESNDPEPVQQEAAEPEPVQLEPAQPAPDQPEPAQPAPAQPGQAQAEQAQAEQAQAEQAQAEQVQPEPEPAEQLEQEKRVLRKRSPRNYK